ncbi:hypothetical protein ACFFIO_02590 [Citricoccus parietis]|uniref:Uncharacterized protein n=1 Tax=Citricoccus parietis TaxID=592307 RepID=A0ABV6F1V1_9MICC
MVAVVAEILTVEEARERLGALCAEIASAYGSVEHFETQAHHYGLDATGLAKYDRMRELEYLLSE